MIQPLDGKRKYWGRKALKEFAIEISMIIFDWVMIEALFDWDIYDLIFDWVMNLFVEYRPKHRYCNNIS